MGKPWHLAHDIADVVLAHALLAGHVTRRTGKEISMSGDCIILIFAIAPVPGYAKTRLARNPGNDSAAHLALRMLENTVDVAVKADVGPVQLCCAPDASHPAFTAAREQGILLKAQGEGDLGASMHWTFCDALLRHQRAIVIGTDAPALGPASLKDAAESRRTKPAVFAPASDGGYALVGLSAPVPELFEDMAWNTASVMEATHERLKRTRTHFINT